MIDFEFSKGIQRDCLNTKILSEIQNHSVENVEKTKSQTNQLTVTQFAALGTVC